MQEEVEFFKWLKGYVEITGGKPPTEEQWGAIVEKLLGITIAEPKENTTFYPSIQNPTEKPTIKKSNPWPYTNHTYNLKLPENTLQNSANHKVYIIYHLGGGARAVCTDHKVAKKLHILSGNTKPLEEVTLNYIDKGFKDLANAIGAII